MNRRDFVKLGAMSVLAGALNRGRVTAYPLSNSRTLNSGDTVLVIGAGIAGLAAARDLKAKGATVIVLEGRDRIGGRIWTDRTLGSAIDMGATWIHGIQKNPVTALAKKFKAKSKRTKYENTLLLDTQGQEVDNNDETYQALFDEAKRRVDNEGTDISIAAAIEQVKSEKTLSAAQLLRLNWDEAEVVTDTAEEISKLSMLQYDEDEEFNGPDVLFPKGYDQIVNGIAQGLDIRLGQIVQRIEYDQSQATVTTNKGVFNGSAAIVTLPLGVLKSGVVTFTPELSGKKLAAIGGLGMGTLNKVALRFPAVFWPKNQFLSYISATKGEFPEFLNMNYYLRQPILVALTGGDFARSLEPSTDGEVGAHAVEILRKMFGSSVPDAQAVRVTRWSSDIFAGGSYSNNLVGSTFNDYDTLAEPVGALYFAGEATNRLYPNTVHGAYMSGIRESERLLPTGD